MYGPQAAFISELFPTRYRYSGASIAYQVTSIFAGSLAPIIAVALLQRTDATVADLRLRRRRLRGQRLAALMARETRGQLRRDRRARTAQEHSLLWRGRRLDGRPGRFPVAAPVQHVISQLQWFLRRVPARGGRRGEPYMLFAIGQARAARRSRSACHGAADSPTAC